MTSEQTKEHTHVFAFRQIHAIIMVIVLVHPAMDTDQYHPHSVINAAGTLISVSNIIPSEVAERSKYFVSSNIYFKILDYISNKKQ